MSIDLYPEIVLSGDRTPDIGPEIEELCDEIRKACKGFGTNEKRLIKAMTRDQDTRTKIALHYESYKGKNLEKLVDKECGGDFGEAMELLAVTPDVAEARLVRKATKGVGTTEKLLYTIICGRSNADIDALRKAYFREYEKDLGSLVKGELGGDLEDFCMACIQGLEDAYDPDLHTEDKAKEDAEAFHEAGEGRWGTDEKSLFKLVVSSPPQHLKEVNRVYTDKNDVTMFKALEKELGGDVEDAVLFALGMKLKPYETVAKLIKSACSGVGTDELLLTSAIIRYQKILPLVQVAHMELFGKSIQDRVKNEVGGDFEDVLVAIVDHALE
uniref:Annexin n=1 Tax=Odontella aurita TaxID=265563 RepID=A0A7S4HQF8_9STRA|mmetsp:Transcript_13620/g.39775  ORF Transcript_13620/g.39775 Transcript_13620/m.39775 type:complete len:328 (+) Transcript_13620:199-1182(+)|eukprot:CAMPEP_0113542024 /NCGR_PEP_ID=MMETSP0015_2-20120614/9370_1 /TAXON_ID=2838 /ORGANISM="Odontella" /LENGTH=327 /DNA_ID=CAMNT_0000442021 /DNA_START=180 /DNA_END=1163 /DNA_ORIENTATION=+ /assembly_acc=CAM_ASM_000160